MAREDWGEGEGGCGGEEEADGGSNVVVGEGSVGREVELEVGDGVKGERLVILGGGVVEAIKEKPWMKRRGILPFWDFEFLFFVCFCVLCVFKFEFEFGFGLVLGFFLCSLCSYCF